MSMVPLALKLPTVNTNNKAEILGCVQAIKLAIECFKKTGRTVYRIVGDSTYVIQALQNHKLTTLTLQKSDQTNWDEWNQLRAVLAAMPTEMQVTFSWIPRSLNAASDRLANNVLDAQEYDVDFCKEHPPIPMILPDDEIYHRVEDFWFQARPSCRYLSNFLIQPWKVAFFNILRLAINNPKSVEPWAMLLSLPKVLLFPQPKAAQKTFISQNSSYEKFVELFRVTVGSPRPERGESTMQSPPNVAQVVEKLVAQNRIAKALDVIEGSRVAVQKPTMSACTQFWPRRQDDIHVFPDVPLATIQFASILAATRKFSKGRAPDILGWNKELFLPIVTSADDDEKLLLEQFFFLIANDMLPSSITTILTCDKGMFLGTPEKSRPIVMSNFFGKVLWKMTFMRRELDRYFPSQDPAATAAIIAHSVADLNMRIIKLDGKNAFQSMVRAAIFDAIRDIKDPLFCRRWNQCYGAVTSIAVYNPDGTVFGMIDSTTGVRAGCVSASKLFQIAMKRAMLPSMLQIVDDIHYFLPENESWERAEQLLRDTLAYTAVDFFGPKTKFIGPGHHESSFETLGVVIPYNGAESIDALVKKKYQPVKTMIKKIVEIDDVSLQVKLFLLRATELKLRYMFEASLCPAMNQWSETIDNDVFEAISSLFSLKEMPTTRHALISTPVGHGGIGLAQFALRQPWNQCRLTQRVLAMIQRPEHRYFAFCEPSVQGKLRDFPPHLLEVKADEHIVRAIREHPYFQQDKFVYATISQHHPPQRHLLLEIPAEPFKIKDNAMKALIWTRLCHLPRINVHIPCVYDAEKQSAFQHFVSCPSCSQRTVRHNAVLSAISNSFTRLGIVQSVNPTHLPLPKNAPSQNQTPAWAEASVTGPDILLYGDPTKCIDLTIVTVQRAESVGVTDSGRFTFRDPIRRCETLKENVYKEWHEHYRKNEPLITCYPLVMTTTGIMAASAIKVLSDIVGERREAASWYLSWTQLHAQKALAIVQAAIYARASHRSTGLNFLSQNSNARNLGTQSQLTQEKALSD